MTGRTGNMVWINLPQVVFKDDAFIFVNLLKCYFKSWEGKTKQKQNKTKQNKTKQNKKKKKNRLKELTAVREMSILNE
jgi:hypothetical protein